MEPKITTSVMGQDDIKRRRSNCKTVNNVRGMDSLSSAGILLLRKLSTNGLQAAARPVTPAWVAIHLIALIVNWLPAEQSVRLPNDTTTMASASCASVRVEQSNCKLCSTPWKFFHAAKYRSKVDGANWSRTLVACWSAWSDWASDW